MDKNLKIPKIISYIFIIFLPTWTQRPLRLSHGFFLQGKKRDYLNQVSLMCSFFLHCDLYNWFFFLHCSIHNKFGSAEVGGTVGYYGICPFFFLFFFFSFKGKMCKTNFCLKQLIKRWWWTFQELMQIL